MNKRRLITGWVFAWMTASAFAPGFAQDVGDGDTELTADSIEYDMESGSSIYRGNVVLKHGDIEVRGEVVEVDSSDAGISRLRVIEGPGFVRLPTAGGLLEGRAQNIRYDVPEQVLSLDGDAEVLRQGQRVTGESIFYDLARKKMRVKSGGARRARLNIDTNRGREGEPRPGRRRR